MTMSSGTRLGPYEIVSAIGAGGMGEVYKARDTRLDRSVAVKIIPAEFAQNAQLKLRFEREAKVISQLSHPNICALYDVGDNYLVMELLEGQSLAERLTRGPLPLPEVLRYGAQVAEALGQAHKAGVVHRDLKPGNVMITKSGAKLLDFGLAKSSAHVIDIDGLTQQKSLTTEGTILGTFQYMAPEQLEGLDADARTDIFALGALLYEMATGRRAFEGKTKTSLIAAIVSGEPKPMVAIQPLAPASFEHVVQKCLEKDPDDRWQSSNDVAQELRWVADAPQAAGLPFAGRSRLAVWTLGLMLVLSLALVGFLLLRKPTPRVFVSSIDPPEDASFAFDTSAAQLSPDGRSMVFPVLVSGGTPMLCVRSLDQESGRSLKGTENSWFPFWSPDSKNIAFFSDGKMRRIDVTSGAVETIADASTGRGGAWGADNTILFCPSPSDGLFQVAATGGPPRAVTELNVSRGDTSHRFPTFLPDGRHFLVFAQGSNEGGNIILGSLDSKETTAVMMADAGVVFAPPNLVLSVRDRVLRAQRINLKTFKLEGEAVPLAEGVQSSSSINFANMSASANGLLSYVNGVSATLSKFAFVDTTGKEIGSAGPPGDQLDPRLAPDGHAVLSSQSRGTTNSDIWGYDLRRNVASRLTFSAANEFGPTWSPDSKSFVYTSFDHRPGDIFIKRVEGSGNGDLLFGDKRRKVCTDWTRDGKYIIYNALTPGSSWDIEAYSVADRKTFALVKSPVSEMLGKVSPDGKWLAYVTNEASRSEVYVQPFPTTGQRWQISGGGGTMPTWSPDGHRLFYIAADGKMMAAAVHFTGGQFVADAPIALFMTRVRTIAGISRRQYDIASDGRFLMNMNVVENIRQPGITVVQNWTSKLPKSVMER